MPRSRATETLDAGDRALLKEAGTGPLRVYLHRRRQPDPDAFERLGRAEALCQRGLLRLHARRGSRDDPWGDVWHEYDLADRPVRPYSSLRDPAGRYY